MNATLQRAASISYTLVDEVHSLVDADGALQHGVGGRGPLDPLRKKIAVCGLILFGTLISTLGKIAYQLPAVGRDGTVRPFEKPWFLVLLMFAGMSMNLPLSLFLDLVRLSRRRVKLMLLGQQLATLQEQQLYVPLLRYDQYDDEVPAVEAAPVFSETAGSITAQYWQHHFRRLFHKQLLLLLLPTLVDLVGAALLNIGLLSVTASATQMMRQSLLPFSALLGVGLWRKRLNSCHAAGMVGCLVGLGMVAASCLASGYGGSSTHDSRAAMAAGMAMILLSQLLAAAQLLLDQSSWHTRLQLSPLKVVGCEGLLGLLIMVFVVLPLADIDRATPEGRGLSEDTWDSFVMIASRPLLQLLLLVYTGSLQAYNICGMVIAGELTPADTTILQGVRTLFVWIVNLLLYAVAAAFTPDKTDQEQLQVGSSNRTAAAHTACTAAAPSTAANTQAHTAAAGGSSQQADHSGSSQQANRGASSDAKPSQAPRAASAQSHPARQSSARLLQAQGLLQGVQQQQLQQTEVLGAGTSHHQPCSTQSSGHQQQQLQQQRAAGDQLATPLPAMAAAVQQRHQQQQHRQKQQQLPGNPLQQDMSVGRRQPWALQPRQQHLSPNALSSGSQQLLQDAEAQQPHPQIQGLLDGAQQRQARTLQLHRLQNRQVRGGSAWQKPTPSSSSSSSSSGGSSSRASSSRPRVRLRGQQQMPTQGPAAAVPRQHAWQSATAAEQRSISGNAVWEPKTTATGLGLAHPWSGLAAAAAAAAVSVASTAAGALVAAPAQAQVNTTVAGVSGFDRAGLLAAGGGFPALDPSSSAAVEAVVPGLPGEPWLPWSFLQAAGFVVLIAAALLYSWGDTEFRRRHLAAEAALIFADVPPGGDSRTASLAGSLAGSFRPFTPNMDIDSQAFLRSSQGAYSRPRDALYGITPTSHASPLRPTDSGVLMSRSQSSGVLLGASPDGVDGGLRKDAEDGQSCDAPSPSV